MYKPFQLAGLMLTLSAFSANTVFAAQNNVATQQNVQQSVCKGVVKDSKGEPIVGASVVIKGTQKGTTTDINGNFSLANVKQGETIQVSFVGFKTATLP